MKEKKKPTQAEHQRGHDLGPASSPPEQGGGQRSRPRCGLVALDVPRPHHALAVACRHAQVVPGCFLFFPHQTILTPLYKEGQSSFSTHIIICSQAPHYHLLYTFSFSSIFVSKARATWRACLLGRRVTSWYVKYYEEFFQSLALILFIQLCYRTRVQLSCYNHDIWTSIQFVCHDLNMFNFMLNHSQDLYEQKQSQGWGDGSSFLRVCPYSYLLIHRVGVPGGYGQFLCTRAWCSGAREPLDMTVLPG